MRKRALLGVVACAAFVSISIAAEELEGIKCPVTGQPVAAGTEVAYRGGHVYFCCENCPKAFAGAPGKWAPWANHQLVATGQAIEVKCPLTGRAINPETAIDVVGAKIAFCCNNCKGKVAGIPPEGQIPLVFNDAAFDRAFEVVVKKEEPKPEPPSPPPPPSPPQPE